MKYATVLKHSATFFFFLPCLVILLAELDLSYEFYTMAIRMSAYLALVLGGWALSALYDFSKPFRFSNAVLTIFFIVGLPALTILFGSFLSSFFYHVGPTAD